MKTLFSVWIITIFGTTGCVGGHSGVDFVLVDVVSEVQNRCIHTVLAEPGVSELCGQELVRRAAHEWDDAGAKFRTIEDWPEGLPANDRVVIKATLSDLSGENIGGYYTRGDDVRLNLDSWDDPNGLWSDQLVEQVIAHELGHAMGLQHLSNCHTLMAGDDKGCTQLIGTWGPEADDLTEYKSIWN